jgi:hypothetical protein
MKHGFYLSFVCFLFASPLFSQTDSCKGNTWIKLLGRLGTHERGGVLCPSGDGNLYATGSKPDSAVILKINPDGEILWARSFDFFPGYDRILNLSLDSDGMLLGSVLSSTSLSGAQNSCYFKYNPQQDELLWVWRPGYFITYASYIAGIQEKNPGGNYLINFVSVVSRETVIMEIDRQTGQELPGVSWRYNWNDVTVTNMATEMLSIVLHDSLIYTIDGSQVQGGFTRQGLTCISASDGLPKWWQKSHMPMADSAVMFGEDLIVDGDAVVSVSRGNDDSPSVQQGFVFLQKTTLDGHILWVKKYVLLEFPSAWVKEVVRVSHGYVMLGWSSAPTTTDDLFLLKTDLDGNVLWARRYDYSTLDGVNDYHYQNELIEMDGFLYFTSSSRDASGAMEWVLAKADAEGLVGDSCAYLLSTPVETYPVLNPVQEKPPLSFRNLDLEFSSPVSMKEISATDVSGYRAICEHICESEEGCDVKINSCVRFDLLSIAVDADGNRRYRIRFTNSCGGQTLNYVAIQLPGGTVAMEPNDGDVFTTATGHDYLVRNPNYSPFYSVRFKSQGTGIGSGESDVFEYVLPPQAQPVYINILARFGSGQAYEAHLNVFNCPVEQFADNRSEDASAQVSIAPNPATEMLTVTLPELGKGRWRILSVDGQEVMAGSWNEVSDFTVPVANLPAGTYYIRLYEEGGATRIRRFAKI